MIQHTTLTISVNNRKRQHTTPTIKVLIIETRHYTNNTLYNKQHTTLTTIVKETTHYTNNKSVNNRKRQHYYTNNKSVNNRTTDYTNTTLYNKQHTTLTIIVKEITHYTKNNCKWNNTLHQTIIVQDTTH